LRQDDVEPQHEVALAGTEHASRLTPVGLLQSVLDVYGFAGKLREINDHVRAFGNSQPNAADLHRRRQQVAIVRDSPERVHGAQVVWIGEEQFVKA